MEICIALGSVRYLPGSFDKRFAHGLYDIATNTPAKELSEKQNEWMYRLLYKYRRQLPNTYRKYKEHEYCRKKESRKEK